MRTKLLNPFSVSLKKFPFMEMRSEPIYTNGDFKIYKYYDHHFVYTFKNIVIGERGGINKEIINNLATDTKPEGEAKQYFEYDRAKAAIIEGLEAAKGLNFQVS
jgi:hypothetical protein